MDAHILFSAALAGALVVLTPGPGVLAVLGIGAAQGRRAGAGFLFGHLAGDLLWAILALVALVWASLLSPDFFRVLAMACALYLGWLGLRALLVKREALGSAGGALRVERPWIRGLLFGLSNPKSYPVTLSIFAALLGGSLDKLTPGNAPLLLAACFVGFFLADLILIWLVGLAALRALYRRHELWVLRGTGLMFIGFAFGTLHHALNGGT